MKNYMERNKNKIAKTYHTKYQPNDEEYFFT